MLNGVEKLNDFVSPFFFLKERRKEMVRARFRIHEIESFFKKKKKRWELR